MKYTKLFALAAGALFCGVQVATAVPSLRISSGGTTVILTDEDLENALGWQAAPPVGSTLLTDAAPGFLGFVSVTTTVGSFAITTTTGATYPSIGSITSPEMDVLNLSVSSSGAGGTLTVEFSEDGFGPTQGTGGRMAIGGTLGTGASANYDAYADGSNVLFAQTDHFGNLSFGPNTGSSPISFSGDVSGSAPGVSSPSYSLTQVVTITHGAGLVSSSFDAALDVPDGGTTVSLLGLTLLGLGAGRRALRK